MTNGADITMNDYSPYDLASAFEAGSKDWIKARIREAARVLKATRLSSRDRPAGFRTQWPDVVRRYWDVMGPGPKGGGAALRKERAQEINQTRPPPPPAAAITRADEVMGWLLWLNRTQRICLWGRAVGISKPRIARKLGSSDYKGSNVWRYEAQAILRIRRSLGLETR